MMSSLLHWFRSPRGTVVNRAVGRKKNAYQLRVEVLEDRVVPAAPVFVPPTPVYFDDMVQDIAVDSGGNQYVNYSQLHGAVDLDPGPATTLVTGYDPTVFNNSVPGQPQVRFWVKYSPTQEVLWVKSAAELSGIGGRMVVGSDAGVEYLYTFGPSLTKMDLAGNVIWSKAASAGVSASRGVIGADGSIYVGGTFNASADLDTGTDWTDSRDLVTGNGQSEYVAKWTADGTLQWSRAIFATATTADPSPSVSSNGGTFDVANGLVYAGGMYRGTLSLGLTNDRIDSASTGPDGFVATYDANGNFQSVAHFIDAKVSSVRAIGSDVYLTAQFGYTADMDPGTGQKLLSPGNVNGENLAVAKLNDNAGTWTLIWAEKFVSSGSGSNVGGGMEVSGGDLYVSGEFGTTTDFDPSSGTHNLTASGEQDIFAMKLDAGTGGLEWVSQMGSTRRLAVSTQERPGLALVPTGDYAGIYLGGYVAQGPVNFNGVKIMDAGPDWDAFRAKLTLDGNREWSFAVGALIRTIDDNTPGYTESGSGWKSQTSGFNGESRTHAKGTGANTATWTFTGLPNGTYQVVTQFPASGKNASNASFSVNGTLVTLDQTKAPNDFALQFSAGVWANLGTFTVINNTNGNFSPNGTLTVVLSDNKANGVVVADVMQIWFVAPAAPQIGSLTASSNPLNAGSTVTLTASNISDTNPGATIIQVTFFYFDSNGIKVSLGTGTQTSPGVWTCSIDTTGWTSGTYKLFAQALGSDGYLSDPLALPLDLQVL